MDQKRFKRSYNNSDFTTKRHKTQKGLFAYNIPMNLSIAEFNNHFKQFETFVPTIKDNHIRIAYILFDSNVKTSKIIKKLNRLGTIKSYDFDSTLFCSIDKTATEIQSIIGEIIRVSKDREYTKIQANNALNANKQRSIVLLAQNYSEIMGSISLLEKDQTFPESQNQEINHCIWLSLYSFCYFIAYKLVIEDLTRYESLFQMLKGPQLLHYIDELRSCESIQRYLAIDFLWQLTFMKDQFKYEDELIESLIRSPVVYIAEPIRLKIIIPSLFKLLSKILVTDLVNSQVSVGTNCKKVATEFVSNIFLISLPDSIQGITLFHRYVAIKKKCKTTEDFDNEPARKGYTLMIALHEYGHFAQRAHLTSDLQWFNHESPETIDPVTQKKSREAGSVLMTKLFGYDPEAINIQASNFLFNLKNWNLRINKFQRKFQSINDNTPTDLIMNGRTARTRLKVSENKVSLIGCSRSYRVKK